MKRNQPLILTVPEPCSQTWDEMTLTGNGRHCAHCAKTVTDFTMMSDAALLDYVQKNGLGCGRYREDQLARPISKPYIAKPGLWTRLMVSAGLLFVTSKSDAQTDTSIKIRYEATDFKTPEIMPRNIDLTAVHSIPTIFPKVSTTTYILGGTYGSWSPVYSSGIIDSHYPAFVRSMGVKAMLKNMPKQALLAFGKAKRMMDFYFRRKDS